MQPSWAKYTFSRTTFFFFTLQTKFNIINYIYTYNLIPEWGKHWENQCLEKLCKSQKYEWKKLEKVYVWGLLTWTWCSIALLKFLGRPEAGDSSIFGFGVGAGAFAVSDPRATVPTTLAPRPPDGPASINGQSRDTSRTQQISYTNKNKQMKLLGNHGNSMLFNKPWQGFRFQRLLFKQMFQSIIYIKKTSIPPELFQKNSSESKFFFLDYYCITETQGEKKAVLGWISWKAHISPWKLFILIKLLNTAFGLLLYFLSNNIYLIKQSVFATEYLSAPWPLCLYLWPWARSICDSPCEPQPFIHSEQATALHGSTYNLSSTRAHSPLKGNRLLHNLLTPQSGAPTSDG